MFSTRLPGTLDTNAVTAALDRMRAAGTPFIDLTETNPTAAGITYPADLLSVLASPAALTYAPEPLGLPTAREAAAAELSRQGAPLPPEQVVMTASTSEAYSLLFKLLCDPGDAVLIPQPSYPLFEMLSRLDAVATAPYRLTHHDGWSLDRRSIELAVTPRTKAVLVVSPNNPTGSVISADDAAWLDAFAATRDLAVIADEVFLDYAIDPSKTLTSIRGSRALTFSLGGLSKSAGLPQVKLGWMGVSGPAALVADALARLELIADTYLSVSTPVQVAAADLIGRGATVRDAIRQRVATNLMALRKLAGGNPDVTLLEPEAGWCAVVRVPATEPEEHLVLRLLEREQVLVHPGYFFDFAHEAFLVVSLLPPAKTFASGVARVLDAL